MPPTAPGDTAPARRPGAERVVPWAALVRVVEPHHPRARTGRPPFDIETMLRIHELPQWFVLPDSAFEAAAHDMPVFREFARLGDGVQRMPDETKILRFSHRLERHDPATDMLRVVNDISPVTGLTMKKGMGGRRHADRHAKLDPERRR